MTTDEISLLDEDGQDDPLMTYVCARGMFESLRYQANVVNDYLISRLGTGALPWVKDPEQYIDFHSVETHKLWVDPIKRLDYQTLVRASKLDLSDEDNVYYAAPEIAVNPKPFSFERIRRDFADQLRASGNSGLSYIWYRQAYAGTSGSNFARGADLVNLLENMRLITQEKKLLYPRTPPSLAQQQLSDFSFLDRLVFYLDKLRKDRDQAESEYKELLPEVRRLLANGPVFVGPHTFFLEPSIDYERTYKCFVEDSSYRANLPDDLSWFYKDEPYLVIEELTDDDQGDPLTAKQRKLQAQGDYNP